MRTIRTARLRLVPVTPENAATLWHVLQGPDLREFQDLPDVDPAELARIVGARPKRFSPGAVGRFEWLLLPAAVDGGDPLGWVSLRIAESKRSTAEIGYSVVSDRRGRGIATEAVAALIEEGFRHGRLREIRAYCLPQNVGSLRVLRRLGFMDDGMLAHGATVQGRPVDVRAHSLSRARWERLIANRQATRS